MLAHCNSLNGGEPSLLLLVTSVLFKMHTVKNLQPEKERYRYTGCLLANNSFHIISTASVSTPNSIQYRVLNAGVWPRVLFECTTLKSVYYRYSIQASFVNLLTSHSLTLLNTFLAGRCTHELKMLDIISFYSNWNSLKPFSLFGMQQLPEFKMKPLWPTDFH